MRARIRRFAILEPLAVFGLIMAYIWDLRYTHPGLWVALALLLLASHRLHRELPHTVGFQMRNLGVCLREYLPAVAFCSLTLLGFGMVLRTTRAIGFDQGLAAWMAYLPWGIFQQYILNGYFMNRFDRLLPARAAPALSAALFAGAHTPNLFLMAVTLLAGYCCARIYRRHKNLYFLGVAHATLGFLLFLVIPDSISHHLIVGAGVVQVGVSRQSSVVGRQSSGVDVGRQL